MQSILITGSNRGIGLGLVKLLAEQNKPPTHIIATCRSPNLAEELHGLAKKKKNIHIFPFDVTKYDTYDALVKEVTEVTGGQLNLLVNNAAVSGRYGRIAALRPDHLIKTLQVNTIAPAMLTKAFLPLLLKSAKAGGSSNTEKVNAAVINMSSIMGSISLNDIGQFYTYRCSKSALNALTRSMSIDLKESGVVVVSVHPGWVRTDLGGSKAPTSVETAAKQLVSLLSNLSWDMSGQFLNTDASRIPW